jgi:hypothetical protein
MNKKKLNIFLIPGVISIWVLIIIKIFSFAKNPPTETFKSSNKIFQQDSVSQQDTIIIYANYRDPFLPSSLQMASKSSIIKPQIKTDQSKFSTNISWPNMIYGGLIKNTKDGKELALVTISNRSIVTGKNNEIEGIRILAISPDSIKVQLQKETKTIVKK